MNPRIGHAAGRSALRVGVAYLPGARRTRTAWLGLPGLTNLPSMCTTGLASERDSPFHRDTMAVPRCRRNANARALAAVAGVTACTANRSAVGIGAVGLAAQGFRPHSSSAARWPRVLPSRVLAGPGRGLDCGAAAATPACGRQSNSRTIGRLDSLPPRRGRDGANVPESALCQAPAVLAPPRPERTPTETRSHY